MNGLYVTTREAWRAWLEQSHASEREVWVVFYKKSTGKPTLTYDELVEEGLCFGWIDSTRRSLDGERYIQKITPRTNTENWSGLNRRRVAALYRAGKMAPAGLAKLNFDPEAVVEDEKAAPEPEPALPEPLLGTLQSHPTAWENFNRLAPSHRRQYVGWITEAKKEETRRRRLQEAIGLLEQNLKLETKWFNKK